MLNKFFYAQPCCVKQFKKFKKLKASGCAAHLFILLWKADTPVIFSF